MIDIAMIPRTNEPMEGEVFNVQDHARRTGTKWTGTHGEMISSDFHGAEEPINGCWDLIRGRDRTMIGQAFAWEKKKDIFIQDALAKPSPMGLTYCRWNMSLWWPKTSSRSHDVTSSVWHLDRAFWHVWQSLEAQRGPTSPSEGLDVLLISHLGFHLAV